MFRKNKKNTEPLPTIAAIIPAAGSSTRMGQNKLMLPLMDTPVLAHTISAFERCPLVRDIILVCREQDILPYSGLISDFGFHKMRHVLRADNPVPIRFSPDYTPVLPISTSLQSMTVPVRWF